MPRAGFWPVALCLVACSELTPIPAGICGNGVLESREDCDGFSVDGLRCRAPAENGACHLDCSPEDDGSRTPCPEGFGCDAENVCRRALGSFEPLSERVLGSAWSLDSGDFDGDGRADVVTREPRHAYGLTRMRVHYFDRTAAHSHTWSLNQSVGGPTTVESMTEMPALLANVSGGNIGVLAAEADGTLISKPMPSYILRNARARIYFVSEQEFDGSAAIVTLSDWGGQRGLFRAGIDSPMLELAAELPYGVEELAAPGVVADMLPDPMEHPCDELVLAFRGAREVSVFSMCIAGSDGRIVWRPEPFRERLALPDSVEISEGLLVADFDGDGRLDVMVGTDAGPHLAYGDAAGFGTLEPYALRLEEEGTVLPMPLAAGDLTGDGVADIIVPFGIGMAVTGDNPRSHAYRGIAGWAGTPWTEAVIADFNRDGYADVVVASADAVDFTFYNGSGSAYLNPFTTATNRPVGHLSVGDLDGDLINDLAFVQEAPPGEADEVSIAFGNASGAPGPPRVAARLEGVEQVLVFRTEGDTTISSVGLIYQLARREEEQDTALALLAGSPDRNLPCILELSTFADDASLLTPLPLTLAAGSFGEAGTADLAILARTDPDHSDLGYELWLLGGVYQRQPTLERLSWDFDAALAPLVGAAEPRLSATLAAGDLDDDGVDELLLAASDQSASRCLVVTARLGLEDRPRVRPEAPIALDGPCVDDTQLTVADLDRDGDRDVLVLYGASEASRKLRILWGDGSSRLAMDRSTLLGSKTSEFKAFAILADASTAPAIACVTEDSVRILERGESPRRFSEGSSIALLNGGTGIVAADVDGDGVEDLAVAERGAVRILRAELDRQ